MNKITYILKRVPEAGFKLFLGLPFATQAVLILSGLFLAGMVIG